MGRVTLLRAVSTRYFRPPFRPAYNCMTRLAVAVGRGPGLSTPAAGTQSHVQPLDPTKDHRHRPGARCPYGGDVRAVDADGEASRPCAGRADQQICPGLS